MDNLEQNLSTFHFYYYDNPPSPVLQTLLTLLDGVGLPIVFFVGIFTNVISTIVFASDDLRHMSSSVYVLAALVSDTGYLVSLMAPFLDSQGYNLIHLKGFCFLSICLASVSSFSSTWFMVCLTVDNYIAVCHPSSMVTLCTVRRAKIASLVLAVGASVVYAFSFVVSMDSECYPNPVFFGAWPILACMESFVSLILPSVFMVVLVGRIARRIIQDNPSNQLRTPLKKSQNSGSRRPHMRVAFMLLILSGLSMAMKFPNEIIRVRFSYQLATNTLGEESYSEYAINAILLFINQCCFATKFFVFLAFGKNFKRVLFDKVRACVNCFPTDSFKNVAN